MSECASVLSRFYLALRTLSVPLDFAGAHRMKEKKRKARAVDKVSATDTRRERNKSAKRKRTVYVCTGSLRDEVYLEEFVISDSSNLRRMANHLATKQVLCRYFFPLSRQQITGENEVRYT